MPATEIFGIGPDAGFVAATTEFAAAMTTRKRTERNADARARGKNRMIHLQSRRLIVFLFLRD
jgi:hypothetical protein